MFQSKVCVAVLLVTGFCTAQQNIVYNNPTPMGGHFENLGSEGSRTQTVMSGASLTQPGVPVVIRDLFVAGRYADKICYYDDIEIRMGLTKRDPAQALDTDWSVNNPNPAVVHRGPLTINFQADVWKGMGLSRPYVFLPGSSTDNLCVEIIIHSAKKMTNPPGTRFYAASASSQIRRAYRENWGSDPSQSAVLDVYGPSLGFLLGDGNFVSHGQYGISTAYKKVEISADTYPQAGKTMTLKLTGGGFTRPTFLAVGAQYAPFDMTVIGAPRSYIWFAPLISVGMVSDAKGEVSLPARIPSTLTSGTLYVQWYQIDPGAYANTLGLVSSTCGTIIFGN